MQVYRDVCDFCNVDAENVSMVDGWCYRASTAIFPFRQCLTPSPTPHRYIVWSEIELVWRGCRFYRFVLNFSRVDPENVSPCSPRLDGNFFVSSLSNTLPYLIGTSFDQKSNGLREEVGFTGFFWTFLGWIRICKYLLGLFVPRVMMTIFPFRHCLTPSHTS